MDIKYIVGGGVLIGAVLLLSKSSGGSNTTVVSNTTDPGQVSIQLAAIDAGSRASETGAIVRSALSQSLADVSVARSANANNGLWGNVVGALQSFGADHVNMSLGLNDIMSKDKTAFVESLNARAIGGDYTKYHSNLAEITQTLINSNNSLSIEGLQSNTQKYLGKLNNITAVKLGQQQTDRTVIAAEAEKSIAKNQSDNDLWGGLINTVGSVINTNTQATASVLNTGTQAGASVLNTGTQAGAGVVGSVFGGGSGGGSGGGGGGLMSFFSGLASLFGMR